MCICVLYKQSLLKNVFAPFLKGTTFKRNIIIKFIEKVHNLRNFHIFPHESEAALKQTLSSSLTFIARAFFLYTFNHFTFPISKIQL